MAFVYPAVAIAASVLGPNRLRRAPNVQRESCLSDEDKFLSMRLSPRQIHQLALEYIRWRRQVDGANFTLLGARVFRAFCIRSVTLVSLSYNI